jgi:hypothetical protein
LSINLYFEYFFLYDTPMTETGEGFSGQEPAETSLAKKIARRAARKVTELTNKLRAKDTTLRNERVPMREIKTLVSDVREILKGKQTDEFDVTIGGEPRTAVFYFRVGETGTQTTVHLVNPNETDTDGLHPFSGLVCSERQSPDNPESVQIRVLGRNGQAEMGADNRLGIVTINGENVREPGARERIEEASLRHQRQHGLPLVEFMQAQEAIEQIKEQRAAA